MKYVVKVRRFYGELEVTSVLYGPISKEDATDRVEMLRMWYQDTDAYYIEEWDALKWRRLPEVETTSP